MHQTKKGAFFFPAPPATWRQSDLEEVPVHDLQAAGGAQGLPLQGGHRVDGGRRRGGEGGRRVRVLLEEIVRPGGALSHGRSHNQRTHAGDSLMSLKS